MTLPRRFLNMGLVDTGGWLPMNRTTLSFMMDCRIKHTEESVGYDRMKKD